MSTSPAVNDLSHAFGLASELALTDGVPPMF